MTGIILCAFSLEISCFFGGCSVGSDVAVESWWQAAGLVVATEEVGSAHSQWRCKRHFAMSGTWSS